MWNPNKLSSRRSPRLLTKISSEERPRKVPASTAAPQVALRLVRFEGGMKVRCGTSDINERGQILKKEKKSLVTICLKCTMCLLIKYCCLDFFLIRVCARA